MKPKHFIELTGPESEQLPPLLARIRDEVEAELQKAQKDGDAEKSKAKVYYAIASTAAIDRDDEVLIPKGVDVRHFETNPVMLHIHNYRQVPAGRVHRLDVSDEAVGMAYSFAEGTVAGDELKHLYDNDFMRAFSVGFIPRGIVRIDEQTPNKIDVDLRMSGLFDCRKTGELVAVKGGWTDFECRVPAPENLEKHGGEFVELKDREVFRVVDTVTTEKDGESSTEDNPHKFSIDLTKYERRPRAVIAKWELLEISPVPIGSNPEALLQRCIGGLIRKYHDQPQKLAQAKQLAEEKLSSMIEKLEQIAKETEDLDIRNAVPPHTTPSDLESEWTPDVARAQVARWASEDGTGNKEQMDWLKFSQGFAWFDGEATNSFSGYKLLHHEIDEEKGLVANFAGVRSAMATLLADNVDVEGDALAVYEHLARHYRDVGAEVPPFERDYSPDELKAIEDGVFENVDKGPVATHTTPIDNEAVWNGPAARTQLRRWASSDDSGDPETIDWARYARGFAWFDSENRETLGAYSLPHHVVRDGNLVGIWRGITAAMGALLGARGGTNIPDAERTGTYNHLARHYRDNDREAPPLTRDYSDAEIKAITLDLLQFEKLADGDSEELVAVQKDEAQTGAADGHRHLYDPGKHDGRTSTVNGHAHEYHRGQSETGPGPNGHRHSLDSTRSLDDLHSAMWDDVEARAVVQTGVVNGHSHSVDNMRTGNTSVVNGHSHPYTAGANRTGPGGSDNHVHPVASANANENSVDSGAVRELLGTLAKRVEELEAEFSVRLGILHNMLDEMGENILSAIEGAERGAGSGTPAAPGKSDGDGSDGDGSSPSGSSQNEAEEDILDRGVIALEDFLKAQNGNG